METSLRLEKIISLIDKGVIADIGCDHALVCLGAITQQKAYKAYACDLRPGPLQQAAVNIQIHGLQDQIFPRLQDGIQGLPQDVEEIVLAGMGGKLMIDILSIGIPNHVNTLLLAPHKDVTALRTFLVNEGFDLEEWMVHERHFYPILKATRKEELSFFEFDSPSQPKPKNEEELDQESLELGYNVHVDQDYLDFLVNQKQCLEKLLLKVKPSSKAYQDFFQELTLVKSRLKMVSLDLLV